MAEVIGWINDAVSFFQTLESLIPGSQASYSTVRVEAGLNGNGLSGADGTISMIRIYDNNQNLIGQTDGGYVSSGGYSDFNIEQSVCVSYASTSWTDGSQYAWVGDWGYLCGLPWYYGNVYVDNGGYAPRCTWIDGDDTNGLYAQSLLIDWTSFVESDQNSSPNSDPNSYCGYPALRSYTSSGGEVVKRDKTPKLDSRLVISSAASHNATELCSSETSRGPDLVSMAEGVFCDMATKEVMPLCDEGTKQGCFHVDSRTKLLSNETTHAKPYTKVLQWK
ncbi:hypothetical protein TASIC1_0017003800 [Trichoderma asperellum]|uniref:Uncharacterized protein n=1 Tax=Trichoderma asperellum TaxID=101201 RepID=A0A6V8R834_TRIAP|nr:hypothetical protein TASIC1_0017003800 [Trichoderma asperellum]